MKKARDSTQAQSRAFVEAARALECDESEERFDAALKKVALSKKDKALSPLEEFWERARIAADKEGYTVLMPSSPSYEHE
jgi:hypothetical protein